MSQDTLVKFGKSFQTKTIASLLSDKQFLDQIMDVLRPEFFDTETDRMLVSQIMSHYDQFRIFPTIDAFKVYLTKVESDAIKIALKNRLKEIFMYVKKPPTDMDFVKEEFLGFCKNQKLKTAILESVTLLERGEYETIMNKVVEAVNAGTDRNIGHVFMESVEERMTQVARNTVSTGWEVIDDIMDGGLGPGELGVIVAPAGIGKSWVLVSLGGVAVRKGLFVVHVTLELSERYTGLRYDSFFSGMPVSVIKDNQVNKDKLRAMIETLKGDLIIKNYPTKSVTVSTISALLDRIQILRGKPDLVIVDYADILMGSRGYGDVRHLELGGIYEELRALAGTYEIPIWTASQANRSSLEEDIIQADKVAESYNKVMIADFIASVSRKINDKISNTARFHVIKNRFGPDGLTYPSRMDTSIGKIEIFDPNSSGGISAAKDIDNSGDMARQLLKKKYTEMNLG